MAAQMEGPGQVQEFLEILTRRKWQIAIPAMVCLSVGIAFAVIVPKKFQVSTQVELRSLLVDDDQRQAARDHTLGVAENAPQQLSSPKRIKEVLEDLKWPDYLTLEGAEQAAYHERIRNNMTINVPAKSDKAGSSFVTIEFRDVNADHAQDFLRAIRTAWITQVVERERTRVDVEYQKLQTRLSDLEKEYAKKVQEQNDLRYENNLSPTQPTPGKNSPRMEDPTFLRFYVNSERKDEVDNLLGVAQDSLVVAREQLALTDPERPKETVVEGLSFAQQIQALRTEQLEKERLLNGIRPEHPRYKLVTRQLAEIDERIAELELSQTDAQVSQGFEQNPAYAALESIIQTHERAVAALSAEQEYLRKLLEGTQRDMRSVRDAFAQEEQIATQIERLKASMADTDSKLLEKRQSREVIYGIGGNPFQVIQEVEPPLDPTEPNPWLIIGLSLVLGLGLGLGSSIVLEFSTSAFRNAADLHRVLLMPVLGVIGPIVTRTQVRRHLLRRVAVASFSIVLVTMILFIAWAWAKEPGLLGDDMNNSIQGLRSLFL